MKVYKRKGRPVWGRAAFAENHFQHPHRIGDGRRAAAAQRIVALDCGCPDPRLCRCTEPPLSNLAIDGWRDAARHLLCAGRMPLVPLDVRRALYRRGGADRQLAEKLHAGCGGQIA